MARAHPSNSSWQRQRGEPPRAHALFEAYLSLGPGRSLRDLPRTTGAAYGYLKKLSARWRWHERAGSWQLSLQQTAGISALDAAGEARERQIRDAQTLQQLARAQLARWIAKDPEGRVRLRRRLTAHQVARVWQAGYRVEHELLPPPGPAKLPEMRHQLYAAQREREEASSPAPKHRSLRQELIALVAVLREARLTKAQIATRHAQLLRWLWLPEEPGLSLEALLKAQGRRKKRHGHS